MMALFAEVAAGGRVVLVATHAMQSLERCRTLAVLVGGRLAWFGPPADAPAFFRADRLEGIFEKLPLQAPAAWARMWLQSPMRTASLTPRRALDPPTPAAPVPAAPPAEPARPSAAEQLAAYKARLGKEGP